MASSAFEHQGRRRISALKLDFDTYVHRVTGARHFHMGCEDPNNAFMVAFPTLPADSTGVAHILEHTTLCGSRRYPVRDPFFMMLRRSLNTYMNAFTSGDSTAYPFATQNRKDFSNLLGVYLDAVFFPTLDPLDFAQEGWRLDVDPSDDAALLYKGVVYNEMKGAMSAPSMQLWYQLQSAIFRETVYHFNSGGDPSCIPELTHAQLKAFHAKHYHPTHAIFMTYGNFPVSEHHAQIESLALNEFSKNSESMSWDLEPRLVSPIVVNGDYAVTDVSELKRSTHVVWGWLLGESADPKTLLEAHLLAGILLDHSASPLRHYLETTALADAPSELCGLDDSGRELVFCCGVEGTEYEHVDQLNDEILRVLEDVAAAGVEHRSLVAILDRMEMAQRDIGGGGYPYGLQLMGRALPGALYGADPSALLDIDGVLADLRDRIGDPGYIESLVRDCLVNNRHRICAVMRPDEHKFERDKASESARLAAMLKGKNAISLPQIRAQAARLKSRQDEPANAEILPKLTLADVPRRRPEVSGGTTTAAGTVVHHYPAATNGLVYMHLVFDLPRLDDAELAQLPIFCEYLTELGAGREDYLQTQARRALAGNIHAYASAHTSLVDVDTLDARLVITAKDLWRKHDDLVNNLFEVLEAVRFDETQRLLELIAQSRVDAEASITDRGHQLAMRGAARSLSIGGFLDDLWDGPASIAFVQSVDKNCHDRRDALDKLAQSFERIRSKLLGAPRRTLVVGEEDVLTESVTRLETVAKRPQPHPGLLPFIVRPPDLGANCAWITNTEVNFCAKAYPAVSEGHRDAPTLAVLANFLTDGYLHPMIREKGGAYGAGAQFDLDSASFRFYSYRDPRLAETLDDFDRAPEWLTETNDAQRLEESILGVIRTLDKPRSPSGAAIHAFYDQLDGRDGEFRAAYRNAVLNTTSDEVQAVARRYLDPKRAVTAVLTHAGHNHTIRQLHLNPIKL